MCLVLTIRASAAARDDLARVAASLPAGTLRAVVAPAPRHRPRFPWARPSHAEAVVSEDGGCACSLLDDDADWDAPTWAMRPEAREALARTLAAFAEGAGVEFAVEALWAGERAAAEHRVTGGELVALARSGALGTRARYVVSDALAG
jgi:hypothetical protein